MYLTTLLADPALRPPVPVRFERPRPRPLAAVEQGDRRPLPWGRVMVAVLVALVVGGLGFLRVWPPLATVMSASMAPTINTGDMVVLKRLNRPVRPGDIAVIPVPDEARSRYGYPPVVIHRVMSIAADGQVTTKGDARPEPDPFKAPSSALTSKVIAHVPAGGRALAFLSSGPGLLWLISGGVLLLGMPLLDRQRDGRRREEEASADLHAQLASLSEALEDLRVERLKEQLALQRRLEAAQRETAAVQERLLAATSALTERLPQLIEQSVAAALPAQPAPPAEPPAPVPAAGPLAALRAAMLSFDADHRTGEGETAPAPADAQTPPAAEAQVDTAPPAAAPAPIQTATPAAVQPAAPQTLAAAPAADTPVPPQPEILAAAPAADTPAPPQPATLVAAPAADTPAPPQPATLVAAPAADTPAPPQPATLVAAPAADTPAPPWTATLAAAPAALLPAGIGALIVSRPARLVAASAWDAPPRVSTAGSGWEAAPAPRFRRSGGMVAASAFAAELS